MNNNNITSNLSDINNTLESLKDQLYFFLMVLILWCIYKLKKILVWIYHKVCPSEIAQILDEPEEATEIISTLGSTTQQQSVSPGSPVSRVYSNRSDTSSTSRRSSYINSLNNPL